MAATGQQRTPNDVEPRSGVGPDEMSAVEEGTDQAADPSTRAAAASDVLNYIEMFNRLIGVMVRGRLARGSL